MQRESSYITAYRDGFVGTSIDGLSAGSPSSMRNEGADPGKNRWQNYFGRVNYSFKDKYIAEFVWRYQGTSKFAEHVRFGFFPGVSLAYRISEEAFWKDKCLIHQFVQNSWLVGKNR